MNNGFVKVAAAMPRVRVADCAYNTDSIMNLMAACIKQGSEIEIQCSGEQEAEALKAAVELVESGLGE